MGRRHCLVLFLFVLQLIFCIGPSQATERKTYWKLAAVPQGTKLNTDFLYSEPQDACPYAFQAFSAVYEYPTVRWYLKQDPYVERLVHCNAIILNTANQEIEYGSFATVERFFKCPDGLEFTNSAYICPVADWPEDSCGSGAKVALSFNGVSLASCKAREKSCPYGNPVFPGTGIKVATEIDYAAAGADALSLIRTYRSSFHVAPKNGFGAGWMHQYQKRLDTSIMYEPGGSVAALRGDGNYLRFFKSGSVWLSSEGRDRLIPSFSSTGAIAGWQYESAEDGTVEAYDNTGLLRSVTALNGWQTGLVYSDATTPTSIAPRSGLLIKIRGQFGREMQLIYDSRVRITRVVGPAGKATDYQYDNNNMLVTATWADQKIRQYHYEDSRFTSALTGITDEKGVRYATYAYDSLGRAVRTEHAGGVDRFQFNVLGNGQTSVISPSGTGFTLSSELQGTVLRPTSASAACPECGDISKTVTYDAVGNVASKKDFADTETRYSYDVQGREAQRIEGYGTADAKTTTTEWHPTWNLPLKIAAPGRVDYFTYDGMGQMTAHGWFPTADANGSQAVNAVPSGAVSGNTYGYDANGLMTALTEVEDGAIAKQWSFTYDVQGNLLTATDGTRTARGLAYDAAGRLLEAVNIDGDTLKYVYDSRGRVTQYVFGENVTAYVYDAIGQKIQVTSPQGDVTNYVYDGAHRLIDVLYNGESLTAPEASETAVMTMARAEPGADNVGANPFASWFGWLAKFVKWLLPSAHAQGVPAPSPPIYGGGGSALGTYTPNPLQELVPGLSGEKTPGQWLAMATQRVIDYCRSKVKEQIHQGKINAQGAGYRDPGVGDAEKWGPQLDPPTVEWGLGALERIEARMNRTQLRTRNQALKDAKRYVVSTGRAGGLDAVRKKSFYNDEIRKENEDGGKRDERVDVDILSGKAFVP